MSSVLTYYLTDQCGGARPFCRNCVNSFTVTNCLPICTDGPSVICLKPALPPSGVCDSCKDGIMPLRFLAVFTFTDGRTADSMQVQFIDSYPTQPCDAGFCSLVSDTITDPDTAILPSGVAADVQTALTLDMSGVVCPEQDFEISWSFAYLSTFAGGDSRTFVSEYVLDPTIDITEGEGCNRTLVFNNISSSVVDAPIPVILPPDGSTITLYPIIEGP